MNAKTYKLTFTRYSMKEMNILYILLGIFTIICSISLFFVPYFGVVVWMIGLYLMEIFVIKDIKNDSIKSRIRASHMYNESNAWKRAYLLEISQSSEKVNETIHRTVDEVIKSIGDSK